MTHGKDVYSGVEVKGKVWEAAAITLGFYYIYIPADDFQNNSIKKTDEKNIYYCFGCCFAGIMQYKNGVGRNKTRKGFAELCL